MPIVIGAKRESDFTGPLGMLSDCHRRIEMFLNVLVQVAEHVRGGVLNEEHRGARNGTPLLSGSRAEAYRRRRGEPAVPPPPPDRER